MRSRELLRSQRYLSLLLLGIVFDFERRVRETIEYDESHFVTSLPHLISSRDKKGNHVQKKSKMLIDGVTPLFTRLTFFPAHLTSIALKSDGRYDTAGMVTHTHGYSQSSGERKGVGGREAGREKEMLLSLVSFCWFYWTTVLGVDERR